MRVAVLIASVAAVGLGCAHNPCPESTVKIAQETTDGRALWCTKQVASSTETVRHGPYAAWHSGTQKAEEGTYVDGAKDGTWTAWHDNGQKRYQVKYLAGAEDGLWIQWYPSGQKQSEGIFQKGRRTGVWREWFPNGKRKLEAVYRDGKLSGSFTKWYPDGQLAEKGQYSDDLRAGIWSLHYRSGAKISDTEYEKGTVLWRNCWNVTGHSEVCTTATDVGHADGSGIGESDRPVTGDDTGS